RGRAESGGACGFVVQAEEGRGAGSVTGVETGALPIPLQTLRYQDDVSSFGFQVRRYLQRRGEIDEWASVPRTAKGEVSYYGTVDGISGLHARRLAEMLVYGSRRVPVPRPPRAPHRRHP